VNTTERERLAAARAGDRQAFDQLCQIYRQEIYALCFRFLSDREDTQDLVQETFARAWQHLGTYRSEASFRTWLWEIGRNLCLNHLRARKSQLNRRMAPLEALSEAKRQQALDVPDTRPTPEETLLDAARLEQIRQEIAQGAAAKKWEATDWELFLLRIERNLPYAEFARRHGRDEAYWRNRWRDKIKPVLEGVRIKITYLSD
jgi:RNA polymerase sigma-70 factor (ECF subfamily)